MNERIPRLGRPIGDYYHPACGARRHLCWSTWSLSSFPKSPASVECEADIAGISKAYRVYSREVPDEAVGYLLDHTALVYLMDANGHYRTSIVAGEADEAALDKLRELLGAI